MTSLVPRRLTNQNIVQNIVICTSRSAAAALRNDAEPWGRGGGGGAPPPTPPSPTALRHSSLRLLQTSTCK